MNIFLSLLFFASILALFAGLLKPQLVLKWGRRTRGTVLYTYIPIIFLLFVLVGATAPPSSTSEQSPIGQPASNNIPANQQQAENATDKDLTVDGQLKVHYLDVGQADSIIIQNGTHAMLIDAGNNDDASFVTGYIEQQGIKELEYVVGTHPHEDHIGGLDTVINSFPIGKIYIPKATNTTVTFQDVVVAIQNKGMKATSPVPGDSFTLGDANCTILAPNSSSYQDLNNYSIVIKLSFGNTSFLFNGDAEDIPEREIIAKGFDVSANVLKIGHHGSNSATSTTFLSKVNPQYAVISVGAGNSYGHPTQETLLKLQNSGIKVFRTDVNGTIIATSDGKTISFNCNPDTYQYVSTGTSNNSSTYPNSNSNQSPPVVTSTPSPETSSTKYIGNKNSKKFHLPTCGTLPAPYNQVFFASRDEAIQQGYTPCGNCHP
ncbi:MAG: MBL fold metallo-hydrolase [Syntrophomonadaceae bacterium]